MLIVHRVRKLKMMFWQPPGPVGESMWQLANVWRQVVDDADGRIAHLPPLVQDLIATHLLLVTA